MTDPAQLFAHSLEAAFRGGHRLAQARQHLRPLLPLSEDHPVASLDDETAVWIDAFFKRWENFQDMLEGQIIRGLVILEGESETITTRRDRAQFLEKLGLAPSAAAWFDAGQLRIQLLHSYPLANPKQIHRVNGAFQRTGLLLATF
ncbi:MAG: hypothetical protein ABEJ96_11430, partial [Thiohalorhabdaceae bacterium]